MLDKVVDALNQSGKPLKDSRLLVLGVTYKANVSDVRESPALDLIHLLREKGADVSYHDPYVPQLDVEGVSMHRVELNAETLRGADCMIITAAHDSYDWNWVVQNCELVIDTRNAARDVPLSSGRVVKL